MRWIDLERLVQRRGQIEGRRVALHLVVDGLREVDEEVEADALARVEDRRVERRGDGARTGELYRTEGLQLAQAHLVHRVDAVDVGAAADDGLLETSRSRVGRRDHAAVSLVRRLGLDE